MSFRADRGLYTVVFGFTVDPGTPFDEVREHVGQRLAPLGVVQYRVRPEGSGPRLYNDVRFGRRIVRVAIK